MRLILPNRLFTGLMVFPLLGLSAQAQNFELSPAQRQWIAGHREIRIAPDAGFAPIDSLGPDGRERGLTADYMKLIGTRTGLSFRVVREPTRADSILALREHRVDLLPSAFVDAQQAFAIYSTPYLRLSGAIYVRRDEPGFTQIGQLDGHKAATVAGWVWPSLLRTKGSAAKTQDFPSVADALNGLRDKAVDAYVGDPYTTAQALGELKVDGSIKLSGQLGIEAPLGMAVRSDWPQLREILDAALKSISVDEEKTLRERWLKNALTTAVDASAAAPTWPPAQTDAIEAALRSVSQSRETGDVRKQIEDLLHQAQDDDNHASQLSEQWQNLNQTAPEADAEAQKLIDALAVDDTAAMLAWRAALPERASVEQLESLLARERDAQTTASAAVNTLQTELDRQTQRPAQIRSELATTQAALEKNKGPPVANGTALSQAQALRTQAAMRLASIQIALLNLENRSYEPRVRLLAAQLRERQRTASELGQHVAALENLVLDRSGAAAADLRADVQKQRDQIDSRLRLLADAASNNVTLADKLVESVRGLEQLRTQKQAWDDALRDTAQSLKNTEERIKIGGVSEAVGLILLAEKSRLKPLPVLKRSLAAVQTGLAQTRMNLIDLREQQAELEDLGTAVTQALSRLSEIPAERLNELRTGLYRLLNTRATILPQLLVQQTRLVNAQLDSEKSLRDLVATTEKLGGILDARLLWTPSHEPIGRDWPAQLSLGAQQFFAPARWWRVARNAALALAESPLIMLAAALGLALLYLLRRRASIRLEHITVPMRRIRSDRYRLTGEALLWTVLAASPLPALLWLLGNLCRLPPASPGGFTESVGYVLGDVAWTTFALSFLHALTMENGLAQYHFRWPRPRREALTAAVPWLALIVLPTQLFLGVMQLRGDNDSTSGLGRLLLTLSLLGFGTLLWQLFAPGKVWTTRNTLLHEPLRLRQAARGAASISCLLLAALVLRGYFVTAFTLSGRVLDSLALVLAVATVHGLAVRWLILGERRLALKRMEQKQENEDEQRERSEGEKLPDPEPEEITIASVSTQTRRLLRAITIVALIGFLLWIWSEVTPAVAFLDDIPVWKAQHLSLLDLLEALIVLSLTWVATRNMPGLIEIGVLRRFHMDASTRYAITSLTRYVIVFAGTILGLAMLGLRWSNLQWLAAGFSVGLGFGMQEIFANFVSGLMVLFERPFRIGDIITVGTVEGTVTRIRTRATTIVDWDNKEVMVPNKIFITDRLVNWTLSDSITRVVIKVGIAYRNDPAQAQKLLLDAARAHAQVLADPEPTCWMMGFGDSTQDFELRVYVAEIGQRNPVRTELQMHIAQVFRDNDIEIAFPQLDVRLHQPDAPSADAISASKRS